MPVKEIANGTRDWGRLVNENFSALQDEKIAKPRVFHSGNLAVFNANGEVGDAGMAPDVFERKRDVIRKGAFTIPIEGWTPDVSAEGYTMYYDIPITGLTADDRVDVTAYPISSVVAQVAGFAPVESMAGKIRLRVKRLPAAPVSADYTITPTYSGDAANITRPITTDDVDDLSEDEIAALLDE